MSCSRHGISFSEVDEDEDVFRDDDADSSPSVEAPVEDPAIGGSAGNASNQHLISKPLTPRSGNPLSLESQRFYDQRR